MSLTFLSHSNDRRLPADYAGDVLLWDIDKTYLDTQFSSWRGLIRIPLELAVDKRSIPGSVPLLRALRHGGHQDSDVVPLYFVSGSPKELRKTVERKMTLDGVDYDGITFKDQWGLMRAWRPKDIKAQVGYKLKALLAYRRAVPSTARWMLFGDDVESDSEVFLLFGEVCAGLRDDALRERLAKYAVHKIDVEEILTLCRDLTKAEDPVSRVFIHLASKSDPNRFEDQRIVATRSYVQTAAVLAMLNKVRVETVAAVAHDLRRRATPEYEIEHDLEDVKRRFDVPDEIVELARR